ncbi:LysR family transcriptional regulator [Alterisphingorhabdus coralli]|uniref:LysR family transcriptional regulator n=1 Tax=Alterisphingorhabdus coralli TaxID=3071408 RepID=A0AA97F7R5_9SPHN|nr:LysR family transcriptional regulator [Parasphingorhabdus sp. SCSIO 66989]WOE75481.1 LysR family transcriptional regulator [Parasphingorhabdus sp. SCSIO 66989]
MAQLNYNHLRYFWAVAHEGNLTRAADKLNVSQSALSVQIQKLEAQLDQSLFERRGKRLHLTEAGHIALDYADSIFATGDELLGTLRDQHSAERYTFRVGAVSTLSRNFQIQFLEPLLGRDDVHITIDSGNFRSLQEKLENHEIDVLLTNMPPQRDSESNWAAHLIDEQPVSLIAHPDFAKHEQALDSILCTSPLILPSAESSIRGTFDAMVARMGLTVQVAAEADDMAMLRLLARAKKGLAVIPPIVVQEELRSGELVQVAELPGMVEDFYAITLSRRFPNPLLEELISV